MEGCEDRTGGTDLGDYSLLHLDVDVLTKSESISCRCRL